MRLGVLGTGKIVQELLPVLAEMGQPPVSMLATGRSLECAKTLADKYHIGAVFCQYEELLAGEADTVYIALPNDLHYNYAREALLHGKNVIVEKPIAVRCAEFCELRQLAQERGLLLVEAMTTAFLPAFHLLRRDLPKLGKVRLANLNYSQYSSRYDAFQRGETPPVFDAGKAGGALLDINVYNLYFSAALFGRPQGVSYYANVQRGVDTSGVMLLDYGDMKVVCMGAKDCEAPNDSTIQGETGTIFLHQPVGQLRSYEVIPIHGEKETVSADAAQHRLSCEFEELIRMVDSHDTEAAERLLEVSGSTVRMLEQGRSAMTGADSI